MNNISELLLEAADLLTEGIIFKDKITSDGKLIGRGIKKYNDVIKLKTKNKDTIYLAKIRNKKDNGNIDFDVYKDSKVIGYIFLESHGDTLYINWISVKNSERGKGYANAMMDFIISYGKKNGYKYSTLEVPEESKDAKHIYLKKGYKIQKVEKDDGWGTLTYMIKKL